MPKKKSDASENKPQTLNESHMYSDSQKIKELKQKAIEVRKSIIEMLLEAKSGHPAGSLGMTDIFTALYFHVLNIDPAYPEDPARDRLILSAGHICPVLYSALAHRGFFPFEELMSFRKIDSRLQGHPHLGALPGVENTSGPLGQGLSQAVGLALAAPLNNQTYEVYCVGSEGDLQEGQTWEAAMFAGNSGIRNLTWIIDRNNIQIDGYTENVMPLEPLREKLESFNWYVLEIDGHNTEEIINACNMSRVITQRPVAIIAHTIPGKDIDFMEYKFEWHGKPPNEEQANKALQELRNLSGRIRNEDD